MSELTPPSLTTADLRRLGVMVQPSDGQACSEALEIAEGLTVNAMYNRENSVVNLIIRDGESTVVQLVGLEERRIGVSKGWLFVLGTPARAVRRLYYSDGRFVTRQALGLRYPSQDRRVERDVDKWPASKSGSRRSTSELPWGTERGLEHTQTIAPEILSGWLAQAGRDVDLIHRRMSQPHMHSLFVPLSPPAKVWTWEDQPILDISALASRGFWDPDRVTAVVLCWPTGGALERLHVALDLRAADRPYLALRWFSEDDQGSHVLELTPTSRGDPRIICRCTRQRVRMVAFREGRFASRTAQRLQFRSQRKHSDRRQR